jgi:hypothetical protein
MDQKSETPTTYETNKTNETNETNETPIICPYCNEIQLTLISVTVCEAGSSLWYKCSVNKKCKLFQIKNI